MIRLDQGFGVKGLMNNHNEQGIQYCKENATISFL